MKKVFIFAFVAILVGLLYSSVQAGTTVVITKPDAFTTVVDRYSHLHLHSIDANYRGKKCIDFDYMFSDGLFFTDAVKNTLLEIVANKYTGLHDKLTSLPVVTEMETALFTYYAEGNFQNQEVPADLSATNPPNTDWTNIIAVAKNSKIVPGRTAAIYPQSQGKGKNLKNMTKEDFDQDYTTVTTYSILSHYSNSEEYVWVDGELIVIEQEEFVYDKLSVHEAAIVKVISPLVLDIKGKGILEASNGKYLPHPETEFNKAVIVDFYGDGFEIAMEWVGPNDGLLVAPKDDGTVDMSCLFGVAGGFDDGFEKLSLYADKNGVVQGDALSKLAVWQDANRNAIADKGEVKSCSELGITSINTKHKQFVSSFVMNGKTHKMWDWWPNASELRTLSVKK